jgi:hypothetical protein
VPGGAASHDQVTGYSRGINGIMLDVRGLPAGDGIGAEDFSLRAGTSADVNPWTPAPAPSSVTVRRGAGTDGSDRVTLTWPDGAVRNTWLQVTMLPTARTGLAAASVSYFGSLVGNTDPTGAPYFGLVKVGIDDLWYLRRAEAARGAPPAGYFDINRDGVVNVVDEAIVRANFGRTLEQFSLLSEAAPAPPLNMSSAMPPPRRRDLYVFA